MNQNDIIEQLVEETLDLLERPVAPPPNPLLARNILQTMEHRNRMQALRPALRPALLAAFFAANLLFSYMYFSNAVHDTHPVSHQELIDVLMVSAGDNM